VTGPSITDTGVDPTALRAYMEAERPGVVSGELRTELISGGKSNLTFALEDGASSWILRRPPLGRYRAGAHDMEREYTVMRALADSAVPVPGMVFFCEDESVLGAPFFLMEKVEGEVYRDADQTATLGPAAAAAISDSVAEVLARLHAIEPAAVGLGELGRPDGYLERQLRRWTAAVDDSGDGTAIPGIEELSRSLQAELPEPAKAAIVHGDYRLDNVIVAGDKVAAVVDWEMATLGDPLADVGMLICYWRGLPRTNPNVLAKGVVPAYGFRSTEELLERYVAAGGGEPSRLDWYVAFGYFKQAVIRDGIRRRYERGETVGPGFETVGELVEPLVDEALRTLRGN
jgi:aminoglycoside phosphotransferase (APT) family kinase protein